MAQFTLYYLVKKASTILAVTVGIYACFLGLLTSSWFQAHAVYLHKIQMTWLKDLNVPESFGFLRGQVTPFHIKSENGIGLYAWHILPIELYRRHESDLFTEPSGFNDDFLSSLAFKLLRDDPEARLVVHMHGAAGTVGSGYRVPNYRALSAGRPDKIHVLTFDYRGFGRSRGVPTEEGLRADGIAVMKWAMEVARIPASRILIFSQSIGTAVTLAVSEHYALQSPPTVFAGTILVAPFVDAATLVATYRLAGTIPLLGPVSKFGVFFEYLKSFIVDKWSSKDRIASYIQTNEVNKVKYHLTIIHAEDDYDIPFHHSQLLFWHAANSTLAQPVSYQDFETLKSASRNELGAAGSVTEWHTEYGLIREEILKTGLHDVIMGNPVVTVAVMRILQAADSTIG